jgi:hypothetical protein
MQNDAERIAPSSGARSDEPPTRDNHADGTPENHAPANQLAEAIERFGETGEALNELSGLLDATPAGAKRSGSGPIEPVRAAARLAPRAPTRRQPPNSTTSNSLDHRTTRRHGPPATPRIGPASGSASSTRPSAHVST